MAQKYFTETGHWLSGGFYDYFMKDGEDEGIYRYGYPISEEFFDVGLGVTTQWFERARFEHNPHISNNEQHVALGLVGVELKLALGIDTSEYMPHFERATPPTEETTETTPVEDAATQEVVEPTPTTE
jgi:hypothetical protein